MLYKLPGFLRLKKLILALSLCIIVALSCGYICAEEEYSSEEKKERSFVAVPIINQNPAIGTTFGAIGMYFFKPKKKDTISPPSVLGVGGFYSVNDSYVFVVPASLFLNEDKIRIQGMVGISRINFDYSYDVEIGEINLVYSELRNFIALDISRRVYKNFYVGLLYTGVQTKYRFDKGTDEQNEFTRAIFEQYGITNNTISSLGINLSLDTRDYLYYPAEGINASVRPKIFRSWLGSDNDYVDIDYDVNGYKALSPNTILAVRLAGGNAFGDVPFDGYQSYGSRSTLRGYPSGKYRGEHMITLQAELRWMFSEKWGMVAFAGTGKIWGSEEEEAFKSGPWLPSIGAGIRFRALKDKKINIRLDYAWGIDGNQGFYIGLLEAF